MMAMTTSSSISVKPARAWPEGLSHMATPPQEGAHRSGQERRTESRHRRFDRVDGIDRISAVGALDDAENNRSSRTWQTPGGIRIDWLPAVRTSTLRKDFGWILQTIVQSESERTKIVALEPTRGGRARRFTHQFR